MITKIRAHSRPMTLSSISDPIIVQVEPIAAAQILPPYHQGAVLDAFELEEAKRQITELTTLKDNWDGYGAVHIQENTKNNALAAADQILRFSPFPTDIAPNSNGTISLDWETKFGAAHLEVGLSRYSFYMDTNVGASLFCDGSAENVVPQLGILISSSLFPPVPGTAALTTVTEHVQSTRRGS
jgi:hypothetical protein